MLGLIAIVSFSVLGLVAVVSVDLVLDFNGII
jgi:hypothetical protein